MRHRLDTADIEIRTRSSRSHLFTPYDKDARIQE